MKYKLDTVLKIRHYNKLASQKLLNLSLLKCQSEEEKTLLLKNKIIQNKNELINYKKSILSNNLNKIQNSADYLFLSNFFIQKSNNQNLLKNNLKEQKKYLKSIINEHEKVVNNNIIESKKLKIIENHYSNWQKNCRKIKDLASDYENDDQNNSRYFLRKK